MSSRNIIIAAIVVLLVIMGVGLYFLFSGSGGTQTVGTTNPTGTLPGNGGQNTSLPTSTAATGLTKTFGIISSSPVLDYFVNATNTVTAIEPGGQIIQIANGNVNTISAIPMQNILSASFSHDGAKALVSFGDPNNPQTSVFTLATKTWVPLAAGLQSPTWSPSDYRITYFTTQAQAGTESLATLDTSKAKPTPTGLTTLHTQDLAIAWPTKTQIILYTKPSDYVGGDAWVYDLQKTALEPIAIETPGLSLLWSGAGFSGAGPMALLFSSGASSLGGSLSLADISGNIIQRLKLSTLPSKCLFTLATSTTVTPPTITTSTPYLYCGVPRDQDTFAISHLPDDYNQMALFTADDVYRINLRSGAIDTVFNDQKQNLDLSDVKFFNGMLFFVNRYDQKLYAIGLMTM
jgi:hypothetical protein